MSLLLALTGSSTTGYTIVCDAGSYTLTGQDASILRGRLVTADAGSYAITGQDASVLRGRLVTADPGAYTIDGQDADIVYTPGSTGYTITCDAGEYVISGQDAQIIYTPATEEDIGGGGGRVDNRWYGRKAKIPRKWWEPEDEPIIAGIESKQALEIIEFEEQLIYEPMAEKVAINSDMIFEKLIQKHEKIKAQIQEEEDRIIELLLM